MTDGGTLTGVFDRTRAWATSSSRVRGWREARYRLFMQLCSIQPDDRILDVGAGAGLALECFNSTNPIVALDLHPTPNEWLEQGNVTIVSGDGTALSYENSEFPVVFCSSVIQSVPRHLQAQFAGEIRRVGQRYFVQTPNRYFPIDPIYQIPFFQFLPVRTQRWLNRHLTLGWRSKGNWSETRYLSARDLRQLFPDGEVHRERVFGLTKSFMVVRRS